MLALHLFVLHAQLSRMKIVLEDQGLSHLLLLGSNVQSYHTPVSNILSTVAASSFVRPNLAETAKMS